MQLGELLALLGLHLSQFGQVAFGSHADEHGASAVQISFHVVQPVGEVQETVSVGDIVDQQHADGVSKVAFHDAFELLLTGSVPEERERTEKKVQSYLALRSS